MKHKASIGGKIILPRIGPCRKCGHMWIPRKEETPRRCARCKHKGWQEKEIE